MFLFDDVIMGLLQERRNSIAYAPELRLSCCKPSIFWLTDEHIWEKVCLRDQNWDGKL